MHKSVLAIVGIWVALGFAQTPVTIGNPGLENGTGGWGLSLAGAATATSAQFSADAAFAHTGTKGAKVVVGAATAQNWHVQFQPPQWISKPNTRYRMSFWAQGPGTIHVGVSDVDSGAGYVYLGGFNASLTNSWTKFTGEFQSYGHAGLGKVRANFYLGGPNTGTFAFDDLTIEEMPAYDQTWYTGAEARILQYRRGDVELSFQNGAGQPLTNASVDVKLVRHAFPFGAALAFSRTDNPNADERWYRNTAASLFNHAVFENDFKWPSFEKTQGVRDTTQIARYLRWADSAKIDFRGHALVWAIQNYGWDTFWATDLAKLNCDQIAANIKVRIERDVTYYKWRIKEYDVWNEPFHEPYFFNKCKDNPKYAPNGWALMDSAYVWAHRADPDALLYVNEYNVVTNGGDLQTYIDMLQGMADRKVPFDGIGVQGHLWNTKIDPARIKDGLDQLALFGKKIKITEFDMGANSGTPQGFSGTEIEQAAEHAKFLRTCFSHPAISGILYWGFWDARHWIPQNATTGIGGGIYAENQTPRAAVDSIQRLWTKDWSTHENLSTGSTGTAALKGFWGTYEASVQVGGQSLVQRFDLVPGTPKVTVKLQTTSISRPVSAPKLRRVGQIWEISRPGAGKLAWELRSPQGKQLTAGSMDNGVARVKAPAGLSILSLGQGASKTYLKVYTPPAQKTW